MRWSVLALALVSCGVSSPPPPTAAPAAIPVRRAPPLARAACFPPADPQPFLTFAQLARSPASLTPLVFLQPTADHVFIAGGRHLVAVPRCGGTPWYLHSASSTFVSAITAIGADESQVVWAEFRRQGVVRRSSIRALSLPLESDRQIVLLDDLPDMVSGVFVHPRYVVFATHDDVRRFSRRDGTTTRIARTRGATRVVASPTSAYFLGSAGFFSVPLEGGPTRRIGDVRAATHFPELAIDDRSVAFSGDDRVGILDIATGSIASTPAPAPEGGTVALLDHELYWTSRADGALYRTTLAGGLEELMRAYNPQVGHAFAVTRESLYVVENGERIRWMRVPGTGP